MGAAALAAINPRLTLSGEMLGGVCPSCATSIWSRRRIRRLSGSTHTVWWRATAATPRCSSSPALKWNVAGTVVVGGHVRWSATDSGLTAKLTPTLAFEYAF